MDKEKIKEIIYIILAILLAIISVKLFIWLLPIILISFVAIIIYTSLASKNVNNKTTNTNKITKKKIKKS